MSSGALQFSTATWAGPDRIGPLRLTAANSSVRFAIRFLGVFTIRGSFGGVEGELTFDQARPAVTSLVARVPVASVHTGNRFRDAHLRSGAWFDAQQHGHIELRAARAECTGRALRVVGAVSIKGRDAPVIMHCVTRSADGIPVELIGRFTIPRAPYGVGPPPYGVAPWDPRAYLVDDDVNVELRLRLDQ
jgi:polyisoprenoid-binding protein YceI